ncbi:nuclear transport factor 2 family protein [Streptococcus halotolerans]|uniref:nuclear transport factor 2 family protein n=1 Tax=Streptococcus halotolerans TaxID=1814128 RepID=UPI0007885472|nr:nuclear transport factor 2 family protein [Streptococcus halotolerans]
MSEEITLKNLYRQVNQAMVDKDIETLKRILEPNTLLVHMTGYQQPVEEWLDQIETEEMKYYSWEEDVIKDVTISGNHASLIGQSRVKARIWGSGPFMWRLQMKMSFEKVDGHWKISKQVASAY